MGTKTILGLLVVVLIAAGALYYSTAKAPESPAPERGATPAPDSSAMRVEENAVMVFEQKPGAVVRGSVHLAAPGYLVIHADANGAPGAILGSSKLLPAGDSSGVQVTLSRAMKEGETLHAMLHFEKGGNTSFSASEDTPVPSAFGGPISGWFEVSGDASTDVPISI